MVVLEEPGKGDLIALAGAPHEIRIVRGQPLTPAGPRLVRYWPRNGPRYREFHPAIRRSFPHVPTRRARHPFRRVGVGRSGDAGIGRRIPDRPEWVVNSGLRLRRGSTWNPGASTRVDAARQREARMAVGSRDRFFEGRRPANAMSAAVICRVSESIV